MADTVAICRDEGGEWEPFIPHARPVNRFGHQVHAVLFSDGTIWDAQNGWRPQNTYQRDHSDELVRRFRPQPIDAAGWAEAAFNLYQLERGHP
jgi:hypothetical protein